MKQWLFHKEDPLKHKDQRVVILIDIQNLYYSAKNLYGAKVDFGTLVREGVGDRELIRAIAYGIRTETEEEKSFFEALKYRGIEVKVKDLQVFPGGLKKGDWDVGIAVDAIKFAPAVDVIILASGDGDFIPLVEYLKNATPVRVELMAFGRSCSSLLRQKVDEFLDLEKDPKRFLLL